LLYSNDDVSCAGLAPQPRQLLMIPKTMKSYLSIGPVVLAVLLLYGLGEKGASQTIRVPEDQETLAAAIAAASTGDTIVLSAGWFTGDVTIEKPVTIVGTGQRRTTITGNYDVLTVKADLILRDLTIAGGGNCVFVGSGNRLTMTQCTVAGAKQDGIGFEDCADTTIEIRDCLIAGNGDGIDLESTQGLIVSTTFINNRDDGLDYDGEAYATCIGCRFAGNGDDGVEIRIARHTQAIFTDCQFTGNGEDGLEIINTTRQTPRNELVLGRNSFRDNARFGVGFVHATLEEALPDDRSRCLALWGPNSFARNRAGPVSENHLVEMQRAQPTDDTVTIQVTREGQQHPVTVPLHQAAVVGTIPMRPAVHGGQALDLEGIAIDDRYIYLADDDTPGIHVVERSTCHLVKTLPTEPFMQSDVTCRGCEGLSLTTYRGKPALLLSDDDGSRLFTLEKTGGRMGAILSQEDTSRYAYSPEGIELVGDTTYLACGFNSIVAVDANGQLLPGYPIRYEAEGYGKHIAGVGYGGERLLLTASAYGERRHTQYSLLIAVDPESGAPQEAWHIPYSNDPRGVAYADGMAYVVDGMAPFVDPDTGERFAPGIRILLFALQAPTEIRLSDLPHRQLPVE